MEVGGILFIFAVGISSEYSEDSEYSDNSEYSDSFDNSNFFKMKRIIVLGMMACLGCVYAWGQKANQEQDSANVVATTTSDQMIDKMVELREVVVKGSLPNTRLKGGSMITRVEGTPLASSGTVDEMLVKIPGMTGSEDKLEVLGKGTPVIYINGRLLRDDTELKRLRSDEIRDVEVINNPGAQYDASVRAVVRIRTKKHKGDGLGLDLMAFTEQDLQYNFNTPQGKLGLNYRKNGVDVFGSAYYRHMDYRQYSTLEDIYKSSKTFLQTGPYTMTWRNNTMVYTAGVNWQISDNHSVGVRADITHYLNGTNKVIYDEDVYENGNFIDHLNSVQTSEESKPLGWLTNAYYNGNVGKLNVDFNFDFMSTATNTSRNNVEKSLINDDFVLSESGTNSRLFAGKLVLSYPLWKGELKAGSEVTLVKRHNTYSIDKSAIANTDDDIKENTYAAFAEYAADFDKYGTAQLGLRYEHVLFDCKDRLASDNLHRTTNDFFPTASYSVGLGPVQLALAYSVKIHRPSFFAMNDAVTYISRYSLQAGNSCLKNQMDRELTFNASWRWLTLTASYDRCKNGITQWSYLEANDAVLVKHINIDKPVNTYSLYLSATPRVGIWSLNATAGVDKQHFYLDVDDNASSTGLRRVYFNTPVYTFNAFNTFSLKNDWKIDVNFMFESHGHSLIFYDDYNNCRLGFVLQKSFLKDKALTLRASIVDVLHRNQTNESADMGNYSFIQRNKFSKHKLALTLFYRFNTAKSKYKGTGAGREAQGRM